MLSKVSITRENPLKQFDEWSKVVKCYLSNDVQITFNIATMHERNGKVIPRNRTVVLRNDGNIAADGNFLMVTENNSIKINDIRKNPNVALTFLWHYKESPDAPTITKQVRVNGEAVILTGDTSAELLDKLYDEEPIYAKIRCHVCKCGEQICKGDDDADWQDLMKRVEATEKQLHDNPQSLKRNENYVAVRITPVDFDFYYTVGMKIADRFFYHKNENGSWSHYRIYA